jgi:hypothetical protein
VIDERKEGLSMNDGFYARISAKYEFYDEGHRCQSLYDPERVFLRYGFRGPIESILPKSWQSMAEKLDRCKLLAACVTHQEIAGEEDSVVIFLPDEEVSVHAGTEP